jgi:hypothetical protein
MRPTRIHKMQWISGTDPPVYFVLDRRGRTLGKVIFKWAFPFNVPFTMKRSMLYRNPAGSRTTKETPCPSAQSESLCRFKP